MFKVALCKITLNMENPNGSDWYIHYLDYSVGFTITSRCGNLLNCVI
jgi:hypothetical protein